MRKNKILVLSLIVAGLFAGIFLTNFSPSVETFAQRIVKNFTQHENVWQYCVITRVATENPPPNNVVIFTGSVNINYFVQTYNRTLAKTDYVREECIKYELNYAEFLQEKVLPNTPRSQVLASQRAADLALAKAMSKLGSEGWEMTDRSFANFNFETSEGNSEYKNSLYFRRLIGQKQTTVPTQVVPIQ